MVTNGAKQAIYNLFQVLLNTGDEVIIPSPYWLSYPQMVRLAGGKPIFTNSSAEDGFKINIEDLKSKISSKTKFIIINSPNNPTGRVMSKEELLQIADLARENPNINILSDEIYELILKKEFKHYSLSSLANDLKDRIFIINGFAKGWAMTGWRIGYLVGPKDVIKASSALQSQSTSNVCSFVQKGALEALKINNEFFSMINSHYDQRRRLLYEGLNNINGIYIEEPNGAFYAFPKLPNSSITSVDFCNKALQDYGLVVVPGKAFGADECIRISCAASEVKIEDGLKRLEKAISEYY
jgi:aspartate aminotransferase